MNADAIITEAFHLWPAWATLVEYVSRSRPAEADPHDIYGAACASEPDRLAALLYAHHHAETLDDAAALLGELLAMARDGRRPRFGRELGLTREMFEAAE
jgi:hypothetical protein